jgi:hypothetical protein
MGLACVVRDREFTDGVRGRDPPDLAAGEAHAAVKFAAVIETDLREPECTIWPSGDPSGVAFDVRDRELTDGARGRDPSDLGAVAVDPGGAVPALGEPERPVGPGRDCGGRARGRWRSEFADAAGCRDPADLVDQKLREPERPVRPCGDPPSTVDSGQRELGEATVGREPPDFVELRVPERAVGPGGDFRGNGPDPVLWGLELGEATVGRDPADLARADGLGYSVTVAEDVAGDNTAATTPNRTPANNRLRTVIGAPPGPAANRESTPAVLT